jgi:hypothetical protein
MQKMLRAASVDCVAVLWGPQVADGVLEAHARGVACRVLADKGSDAALIRRCKEAGVELRETSRVPLKLVVADARGLLLLSDPVTTQPQWTAVFFEHAAMADAMKLVFEEST